jgi:hypothetical protein
MPYNCPECGATYNTDETCEDRFNASQAQELADPAYYVFGSIKRPHLEEERRSNLAPPAA